MHFKLNSMVLLIDQDVTRSIMEQVMINSNGEETEVRKETIISLTLIYYNNRISSAFGLSTFFKISLSSSLCRLGNIIVAF